MKGTCLHISEFGTPQKVIQIASKELLDMVADDKLQLQKPACSFDLTEIQEAIQAVEFLGSNQGKVFLTN